MRTSLLSILLAAAIAGCSGGASGTSQSVADTWPDLWCKAVPGITKEQLVAIMGKPTGVPEMQMYWSAHQYHFTAFLNPDGTVKQLDITMGALSDAEKSALTCAEVRTRKSMTARAAARRTPDACTLVSDAEMSAILGTAVLAQATSRSKCIYKPASKSRPYVEFSVDWGDGKVAMSGIGMGEQHEPGITSPYDGLGDQAAAVGPALMIRTGEDLVTLVFSGVPNMPAVAKRIFETAKAKM